MIDFYQGYLWGYLLMVSFPIGALGIRLVHLLTEGAWGEPLKKYYLAASRNWGVTILLGFPLIFGFKHLYYWTGSCLEEKRFFLNIPFFAWRTVFYFICWIMSSRCLDRHPHPKAAAGGLALLYVLIGSFAGIDWVMSLDPYWYSTIFGFVFMMGQVLLAFCVLICLYVFREKPNETPESRQWLRDQGNLILTMVMLWAYVAFSQYLIIWMGNIPKEIKWYLGRIQGGWGTVVTLIIIGHFFVPFFLLLKRAWKESWRFLSAIALWVLAMRIIDMAWMVFPGMHVELSHLTLLHVFAVVLVIGIYTVYFLRKIKFYE